MWPVLSPGRRQEPLELRRIDAGRSGPDAVALRSADPLGTHRMRAPSRSSHNQSRSAINLSEYFQGTSARPNCREDCSCLGGRGPAIDQGSGDKGWLLFPKRTSEGHPQTLRSYARGDPFPSIRSQIEATVVKRLPQFGRRPRSSSRYLALLVSLTSKRTLSNPCGKSVLAETAR